MPKKPWRHSPFQISEVHNQWNTIHYEVQLNGVKKGEFASYADAEQWCLDEQKKMGGRY